MQDSLNRRNFLAYGVSGFVLLQVGASADKHHASTQKSNIQLSARLIRNPAYTKSYRDGSVVLSCRTYKGESIQYAVDSRGALAFDSFPGIDTYQKGNRPALTDILEIIRTAYPDDNRGQQKKDFLRFTEQMVASGILMNEGCHVRCNWREKSAF
ncbi:MAG TPA: hypothetical protein PLI09_03705 [Candidatus Hydrogenedentes bacterium]|nr:hypothetical protein [Candidatus Hydrogenedentota bacterium]